MNIVFIIIGILFFVKYKNKKLSDIVDTLSNINLDTILEITKGLGINNLPPFLSEENLNLISSLLKGEGDLKTLLPILIKLINTKQQTNHTTANFSQKKSPLDEFAGEDVKTAFYSYLHK